MECREELEAAIDADPYDPRAYAVLADHLQELGDPRGELIALQIANAEPAVRELFERHPALLPPHGTHQQLRWKHGFIQRAELLPLAVPSVLDHSSGRFLAELVIYRSELAEDLTPAVTALSTRPHPTMRSLVIGADRPASAKESEIADRLKSLIVAHLAAPTAEPPQPPAFDGIWPCMPNLRVLRVISHESMLGSLNLPNLIELELYTTLAEPYLTSVIRAEWPRLERLALGFEMVGLGPPMLQHLRTLLESPPPNLVHFSLTGARRLLFDAIPDPRDLATALGRLRSLELTGNLLVDEDVRLLIESGIRLERLDVSYNQLTDDSIAALSAIATTVVAKGQWIPDEGPIEGLYDY